MPPGKGSAAGRKFVAPPYYSQRAVFASPLSVFLIITRTLSTTNKSRVSIRVAKTFDPGKFFSNIVRPHTKFGYCFSYHVHACRGFQDILNTLIPSPHGMERGWPLGTYLSPCNSMPNLVAVGQPIGAPKNFTEAWPSPLRGGHVWPLETCYSPQCVARTNLVIIGQTVVA